MKELGDLLKSKTFTIKPPRKDENKRMYRKRLEELLGRTPRSVWASTMIFTEDMLKDAIGACQHFSNIKLRNLKFNDYVARTKK